MTVGGSAELLRFIRQGRSFSGREAHCVFLNTRDGRFADVSASANLNLDDDGRAVGWVDWDHDGDLDLWIVNRNGPQLRFLQNELPRGQHHYVAFLLRGVDGNRDGIGARVSVTSNGETQTRTLRAGDGYLAQSSKWLHFGLGSTSEVETVTVRWPSGNSESFAGVVVNGRFELMEGKGEALAISNGHDRESPKSVPAIDGTQDSDDSSIRVLSVSDVPVPKLNYKDLSGVAQVAQPLSANMPSRRTTLVNLFATWCQPCRIELEDLSSHAAEFERAKVDVVALCVDPLDPANTATAADIQQFLKELGVPFRAGVATTSLVETLQQMNNHLFDLHLSLPVPMSVLIDRDGKLVALYKGPVASSQVLRDVELSLLPRGERRAASVPFTGRWHERLNRTSHVPLLNMLVQNDLLDEADDFVRRIGEARKSNLLPAIVNLGMAFYHAGNAQKAQEHLSVVRRMEPSFVGSEVAMAIQREKEGLPDQSIKLYREALRRSPNNTTALNNLAWLLATQADKQLRNGAESLQLASHAVKLTQRKNGALLGTLAAAHAELGQMELAIRTAEEGIAVAKAQGKIKVATDLDAQLRQYVATAN